MLFSIATASQAMQGSHRVFDADGFLQEARAAEAAGFYCAYTGERRSAGATSYSHNPLLMADFGLCHTERLRFSAGLVVLPLHHPVQVVQDAALIAKLHPGRFRLCVGAGYMQADFDALGVPHAERAARMEQGLAAIDAYRRAVPMELDGPYQGLVTEPDEAVADVDLDVFAGAWSEGGVRRAARYADGWITGPIRNIRWIAELAAAYRDECDKLGKEPRVVMLREAWLGADDEDARASYGEFVLAYHRVYMERGNTYHPTYEPWFADLDSPTDLTVEQVVADRVLCGGLDHWMDVLPRWIDLVQPEEVILRLRHLQGPPIDEVVAGIERIGREILPAFSGVSA